MLYYYVLLLKFEETKLKYVSETIDIKLLKYLSPANRTLITFIFFTKQIRHIY